MVAKKRILVGVSGGIAAYKTPDLVRRLNDQGAEVRVVMTNGAKAFITPLTLQAVSGNPVSDDLLDPAAEAAMGHIELAKWADLIVIAPASANTIARLTHGFADDLLSTLCLATVAPIAIAPAMNQQMWAAPAVRANMDTLRERGIHVIGPASGAQACGDVGAGRMVEPADIASACLGLISENSSPKPLQGQHVMITAGPTREAIDPVRYISNHSSGKMGFALAEQAIALGAQVTLVCGPVNLATPEGAQRVNVQDAEQMLQAVHAHIQQATIFIGCAAVADYRPEHVAKQKLKKEAQADDSMTLTMVRNPDILASVAALKKPPFTLGFAAETNDVVTYATRKLEHKGLQMIAANDVSDPKRGFNSDDNAITLLWREQDTLKQQTLGVASKQLLAKQILLAIHQQLEMQQHDHH